MADRTKLTEAMLGKYVLNELGEKLPRLLKGGEYIPPHLIPPGPFLPPSRETSKEDMDAVDPRIYRTPEEVGGMPGAALDVRSWEDFGEPAPQKVLPWDQESESFREYLQSIEDARRLKRYSKVKPDG